MSAEKIISQEVNNLPPSSTPKKSEEASSTGRVDINTLLARARNKQRQETKINFVFLDGVRYLKKRRISKDQLSS